MKPSHIKGYGTRHDVARPPESKSEHFHWIYSLSFGCIRVLMPYRLRHSDSHESIDAESCCASLALADSAISRSESSASSDFALPTAKAHYAPNTVIIPTHIDVNLDFSGGKL